MQDDSLPKKEDPKIPPKLDLQKDGMLNSNPEKQGDPSAQEKKPDQKTEPQANPSEKSERPAQEKSDSQNNGQGASNQQTSGQDTDVKQQHHTGVRDETKGTSSTNAATGDSPTIKIKPPELKTKPGTPVKLRNNAGEDQNVESEQDESKKAPIGIPSGRGGEAAKKETSKIPLDQAKVASWSEEEQGNRPKTIKISPSTKKPSAEAKKEAPQSEQDSQDEKRKTSRISLESALGMDKAAGGLSGGPKTIRLKRPGATASKVSTGPTIKKMGGESQKDDEISKTAELKEEPVGEDATPTRRKTIKVKRAGQRKTVRKIAHPAQQRGATESKGASAQVQANASASQKEPGVFFALTGIAAILVLLVTIYVMAAQAFGPNNVSLSQVSYGLPGLDLTWPGEIQ